MENPTHYPDVGDIFGVNEDANPDDLPDTVHRIIVAVILFIVSILGSVGNALVVLSVVASKKLRTSTNVFVVNLAVADFLTSVLLPFLSLSLVLESDIPLPHWLCGTVIAFIYSCLACSLYTLASIAINRFLLITKPTYVCRRLFQPKVLVVWISCIWIISLGIAVLPLALGIGQLGYDKSYHICGGVSSHDLTLVYEGILVLGLYPLPLLVIVVSYTWLYIHIRLHGRRMMGIGDPNEMSSTVTTKSDTSEKKNAVGNMTSVPRDVPTSPLPVTSPRLKPSASALSFDPASSSNITPDITSRPIGRQLTTTGDTCTLGQMRKSAREKISKRHLQITKNLFYIVCAFLLCLTPYFLVFIFKLNNAPVIYAASAIFFNSCINPFVYATKHPHFKKVFKCILLGQLKNVPEPADFLKSFESVGTEEK